VQPPPPAPPAEQQGSDATHTTLPPDEGTLLAVLFSPITTQNILRAISFPGQEFLKSPVNRMLYQMEKAGKVRIASGSGSGVGGGKGKPMWLAC